MKRSEFLQSLGLGATGLILPKSLLSKSMIKIYDNYVRGLHHYDFDKVKNQLNIGDNLILKRDSENIHDSFAVEVYYQEYKLGYLPAYENISIANMLDAKVELPAKISFLKEEKDPYKRKTLGIEIFAELISPTPHLISKLQNKRAEDAEDLYRQHYDF